MSDDNNNKEKVKRTVRIKSPKELLIESGVKIVNKIPDIVPLMLTAALAEVVKYKVRAFLDK